MKRNNMHNKIIGTVCSLLSVAAVCEASSPKKPNIIIILADDMGYGDISALNPESKIKTPHLDSMCEEGMYFTEAHANSSVSTPTRYGILTGRYCYRTSLKKWTLHGYSEPLIDSGRETIASMLKRSGYATACIGKWHLGLEYQKKDINKPIVSNPKKVGTSNIDYTKPLVSGPNHLGFDYSYIHPASLDMPPYIMIRNHRIVEPDLIWSKQKKDIPVDSTKFGWDKYLTQKDDIYYEQGVWWRQGEVSENLNHEDVLTNFTDDALGFIKSHVKEKQAPFFLYFPLTAPHTPWLPADEFKDTSEAGRYGDFVCQIDHIVAKIRQTLKELKIDDNTLIFFTSDNGPLWSQSDVEKYAHKSAYGRYGMKGDIYDGGHRIPLIACWPKNIQPRSSSNDLICLTDIYATIASLTGNTVKNNEAEDSFSFLSLLSGKNKEPVRETIIHHSGAGYFAIRDKQWKLVFGLGSGGFTQPVHIASDPENRQGQLFDMSEDPMETNNVWSEHPEVVKKLTDIFESQLVNGYSRYLSR